MKRAFTLIEVNLAIMIMATGILAIVGLYSFGYRENRQSAEDVGSAAYADAVLSPLVMALSATNVKWSAVRNIADLPGSAGWGEYFNSDGQVKGDPTGTAQGVFRQVVGKASAGTGLSFSWPQMDVGDLKAGLVVMHEADSAVFRIGFRATEKSGMLMAAPLYYTEVRFQGVVDQNGGGD